MRRYFYPKALLNSEILTLEGELFHHIFEVCRMQVGQHFELLNSKGSAYLVKVESVGKRAAQVLVCEERTISNLKEPHIHLFLSFPKVSTFEAIIEKSVEMGVKSITPFLSDFSSVRSRSQFPAAKLPRWQKIILQATQQCGRGDLMELHEVQFLSEILNGDYFQKGHEGVGDRSAALKVAEGGLHIVAYEGEAQVTLKGQLMSQKKDLLKNIFVYIGSEGGFSDQEIQRFRQLDLPPVTLGEQVLRVETACMTLVSAIKYEFEI